MGKKEDMEEAPPGMRQSNPCCGPLESFQQQKLFSCTAVLTPCPLVCMFLFFGLICVILGIVFLVSSIFVTETDVYRYDNLCNLGNKCTFRFEIEEDMEEPIFLYYRVEGVYQNYRLYKDSRSNGQLQGTIDVNDYDELEGDCGDETSLDDEDSSSHVFLPCGKTALSNFNDTFTLTKDNGKYIKQTRKDVSWPTDRRLYEDPGKGTKGIRVVDSFENPNFQVWMRVAALPNFLKLYAVIEEDLKKGTYLMEIHNRFPVHEFEGEKMFKLSTVTWIGGRKWFLGGFFVVVGVLMVVFSIFVCLKARIWPRKVGNIAYLDWD